jgi:hypothetical protein
MLAGERSCASWNTKGNGRVGAARTENAGGVGMAHQETESPSSLDLGSFYDGDFVKGHARTDPA